jgi:hypothetical protein
MDFKKAETPELPAIDAALSYAVHQGWIRAFRFGRFMALKDLHLEWGKSDLAHVSRSHKKLRDQSFLGVEVIKEPNVAFGIDLESRHSLRLALFKKLDYLRKRFRASDSASPESLLVQWTLREAAFKALHPNNQGLVLSDFTVLGESKVPSDLKIPSSAQMESFLLESKIHQKISAYCIHEGEYLLSYARLL